MRTIAALLLFAAGAGSPVPEVTPVRGRSWIQHLGVELDDTHMGKMGGEGPPPATRREPMPSLDNRESSLHGFIHRFFSFLGVDDKAAGETLNAPFTLVGQDLYRLNCQSCHGPDGRGAPPEINSLLDPVRATSPALLEARQREQGRRLPPGMAQQLAADAEKTLHDRLANGGKKMPAFPHLAGEEVVALVDYLKSLVGVPAAERSSLKVTESVARVGEHLVKGTCHICHPATGPGASHMMMYMRGVIPSLASMPEQMSPSAVLGKVREGGMMHGGGMMGRGGMMARMSRMPVFRYLTDEEVVAAYLYLSKYPPQPK
jgi:mono/diheme cytochrome c family protein